MKTRPRPKTKLLKLVEIVPDMYPDLLFGDVSWNPLKISEKGVHRPAFSKYSFITPSRGWHRVAQGDMNNWRTVMVQMQLLCQRSGDYIQEVPWFCISMYTQKGRWPYICLLFSYRSPLQTDNEPNQICSAIVINLQEPGKVFLCTKKHRSFQPPYAFTSSMPDLHLLVNGCWNTGVT